VYPLVTAALYCVLAIAVRFFSATKSRLLYSDWVVVVPVLLSLVYWLSTAPDVRFVNGAFWCLSIGMALVLLSSVQPLLKKRSFMIVAVAMFAVTNLGFLIYAVENRHAIKEVSWSGWHPIKTVALT